MDKTYFLFETAAGYALYHIDQWEQIGHQEEMEQVCCSGDKFKETVQFKAFQPFTTAADALENIRAVVDGEVTPMLSGFLSINMPKGTQLAVVDPALGKSLSTKGFKVVYDPNVIEIVRGCRLHEMKHIAKLASGASAFDMDKFHVGLGHNYSRGKLQVDPRRHDKPVVNCVALLDSLTKNLNSFAMRVREWYGWHFPELVKIVPDNKLYCQCVQIIQCKNEFDWDTQSEQLTALLGEEVTNTIRKAANQSIGHELTKSCMENIYNFAGQVVKLEEMREKLNTHLGNKLAVTAPNLSTVAGNVLTGRLISHAGSLVNLAKMSASSIQILGAEKALFRALKTRSNTPKYGLIFQSNFIGKASIKHKGRAARYLANKCALAARLDCFCDVNTDIYGKHMLELLNKRMDYLAGGPAHETSIDVMKAASREYEAVKSKVVKTTSGVDTVKGSSSVAGHTVEGSTDKKKDNSTDGKKKKEKKHASGGDMDKEKHSGDTDDKKEKKKKDKKKEKHGDKDTEGKRQREHLDGESDKKKKKKENGTDGKKEKKDKKKHSSTD
ncbi:nucleolar protein, putative [Babesia ovis]|uniref:Nucleolar protein 56 n=1 Tax=Babesia ovis TaxID=5869 RepID=A0A9W5WUT7_BABOV|nr:nucleolar protein, putative [Babesia ovis]